MTTGGPGRWATYAAGGLAALALTGCGGVNRRFVIESNVPSATVYINDRKVGPAPAHSGFEYYGYYNVTLVHPDFQTLTQRVHVVPPWYGYPPFDFLAEVVWPFGINDTRRYFFKLEAARQTDTGELIAGADALRARGDALPPPPPQPGGSRPTRPPLLGPPVTPAAGPGPGPAPAAGPPPGADPPSVVPSVTPAGYAPPAGGTFLR